MRKILSIVSFALLICLLSSCAYLVRPEDKEIREALEKLLPDAYTATYIIYGPGIELDPEAEIDPTWKNAHYIPVANDYPYRTVDDVKAVALRAFSADYAEDMFEYAFVNNDYMMSRYTEYEGRLSMDVVLKKPLKMAKEFYTETLHVVKGNSFACKADIECLLANDERATVTLSFVKENDVWKLDGPAY